MLHWLRRRKIAKVDDISVAIGCVNVVLAYYKLCDDKKDGDGHGMLAKLYKKGYRRALKLHSELDGIVRRQTSALAELENSGCEIIDAVCEPTAVMMRELSEYLLKEFSTEYTKRLFYDLGKWVYLADALDDYDKDVKKKRFNVLFNVYKVNSRVEAVKKGGEELVFIFDSLFADMRECLANIKFHFNHDLTDNIILRGIPMKTRKIFYGDCKNNA